MPLLEDLKTPDDPTFRVTERGSQRQGRHSGFFFFRGGGLQPPRLALHTPITPISHLRPDKFDLKEEARRLQTAATRLILAA